MISSLNKQPYIALIACLLLISLFASCGNADPKHFLMPNGEKIPVMTIDSSVNDGSYGCYTTRYTSYKGFRKPYDDSLLTTMYVLPPHGITSKDKKAAILWRQPYDDKDGNFDPICRDGSCFIILMDEVDYNFMKNEPVRVITFYYDVKNNSDRAFFENYIQNKYKGLTKVTINSSRFKFVNTNKDTVCDLHYYSDSTPHYPSPHYQLILLPIE
ncbi:MAG: hypothetical protein EBX41_00600 [Chitinophagia bacterium]|nr:hypothetical protein [Chitinophagia bacterium]